MLQNLYLFLYQRTALHIAVEEGQENTVKSLVEEKADVNIRDIDGVSENTLLTVDYMLYLVVIGVEHTLPGHH